MKPWAWVTRAVQAEAQRNALLQARIDAVLALCDRWEANGPGDAVSITAVRAELGFHQPENPGGAS